MRLFGKRIVLGPKPQPDPWPFHNWMDCVYDGCIVRRCMVCGIFQPVIFYDDDALCRGRH
jgi:hypothetical protein